MRDRPGRDDINQQGFSLIELLVVVIIVGILAAIAIPRYLEQREAAWNTTAVADLRNLVAIVTSLEAGPAGLTEDPGDIAAEGWEISDPSVVACADVLGGGTDILLATWHASGTVLYTWRRADARVVATELPPPANCAAALGSPSPTQVS